MTSTNLAQLRPASAWAPLWVAPGLLAGLGIMAISGVGPVVAAGWFAATLAGAIAGAAAGGLVSYFGGRRRHQRGRRGLL